MSSFEHKELSGHSARGQTGGGGGCMIVFSLPFLTVGILAALRGLNVVTFGKVNAPQEILVAVGAVFALAGLLVFSGGVRSLLQGARRRRVQAMYPHEAWRGEYDWDPQQVRDNTMGQAWSMLFGGAFLFLFLVPFNWWGFVSKDGNFVVMAVAGIFDLVTLAVIGNGFYLLFRAIKYGKSELRFCQFPYFLGETFEARLITARPLGEFSKVNITLQCVQERLEVRGSGKNRSQQIVCYQIYSDVIESNQGGMQSDGAELPITFVLPAQADLTTRLLEQPPKLQYWEIDVAIETPGIDFGATFLVPIYARNATAAQLTTSD